MKAPHVEYDVHIVDQTTGEVAVYHSKTSWYFDEKYQPEGYSDCEWWWTEGNGGCDCNRWDFFRRANGVSEEDIDKVEPSPCSENRFFIPFVSFADETKVLIDRELWCLHCDKNYRVDTVSTYEITYAPVCPECGKALKKI